MVDLGTDAVQDVLRVGQKLAVVDVIDDLRLVQLLGQSVHSLIGDLSSSLRYE